MENGQIRQLIARVNEIAEEHAALKQALVDERWSGVSKAIEDFNEHLRVIYDRLAAIEEVIRGNRGG